MIYLINLLLVPLYYLVLRMTMPRLKANQAFWWVVAVHAILFRALANPYNYVDTDNYANAFRILGNWSLKHTVIDQNAFTDWGRGYLLYSWVVSRFTHEPKTFFFITSIVAVGGVMLYYRKTAYTALAPVLFYLAYPMMYIMGFGVIRQHLAIPFLLFALYYIEKPKRSLLLIVIASLIHVSSIVFIPFLLVHRLMKKLAFSEVAVIFILFFIVARFFIAVVLSYLPRYELYLQAKSDNNTLPALIIGLLLVLLYEASVFTQAIGKNDRNLLQFLLYGFALSVFCIGLPFGGRLTLPIIYLVPTVLSLLYQYGSRYKDEYHLGVVCLFALLCVSLYLNIRNGDTQLLRYSFFWEKAIPFTYGR